MLIAALTARHVRTIITRKIFNMRGVKKQKIKPFTFFSPVIV